MECYCQAFTGIHGPETVPSVVDLFSGCGGLSLGLRRAGWRVTTAVEVSPLAAETYYRNLLADGAHSDVSYESHLKLDSTEQLRRGLLVDDVRVLLDQMKTVRALTGTEGLTLLAGGPPCQGFSLAGRRDPDDPRNDLVWTFLELVKLMQPRFLLLENVSAIQSPFERGKRSAVLSEFESALTRAGARFGGYSIIRTFLRGDHYGVPQKRKRMFLIGIRADVAQKLKIPAWTSWDSGKVGDGVEDYVMDLHDSQARIFTSEDALWDIVDESYLPLHHSPRRSAYLYAQAMRNGDGGPDMRARRLAGQRPANHEFRNHGERTQTRFHLLRLLRDSPIPKDLFLQVGNGRLGVENSLLSWEPELPLDLPTGRVSTVSELALVIRSLGSRKHTQRALDPREPAPTITTLPDDICHFDVNRTLTVREMARLQSFPDSFVFYGKVTTGGHSRRVQVPQYSQVGNAVPPRLAEALGLYLRQLYLNSASKCCRCGNSI